MKLVEQLTDIKVPKVLWEEASIDVLGVLFCDGTSTGKGAT